MSQDSSLTQSGHSVRQALTAYTSGLRLRPPLAFSSTPYNRPLPSYRLCVCVAVNILASASLSPEIPESSRRQFGVAHRVLDIAVTEVGLQRPRVVALVRQGEAAGVPEHVRVGLEAQTRLSARPLNHASEASGAPHAPT